MKATFAQRTAIETLDRPLLIEAGAGAGKTWVLVQRYLHLLDANPQWTIENITAITFTEKAAREMRTRIRSEIQKKYRNNPENPIWRKHWQMIDRLQVGTIHSLCARILRENAISIGVDPYFEVLDEQQSGLIKEQAAERALQELQEEGHPALSLLESLRIIDLRSEIVQMLDRRGILYSIFDELANAETLQRKWQIGLEKMRKSIWDEIIQKNPDLLTVLKELPQLVIQDPQDKLAESIMYAQQGCQLLAEGNLTMATSGWLKINVGSGKQDAWGGKEALQALKEDLKVVRGAAKELEKAGGLNTIGPLDEIAATHLQLWKSLWNKLELVYNRLKDQQQSLDFDDLEILTERLLHQEPRPERLQAYLDNSKQFLVDEFQDTNLIQQRILNALAPIDQPGKLFLVGDAKQSIYRFRQAQVSGFNQIAAKIQSMYREKTPPLSVSFRTHQSLVDATNYLFDHVFTSIMDKYEDYEARPGALTAQRESLPEVKNCVELLLLKNIDANDQKQSSEDLRLWEAQWIAKRLHQLRESYTPVWDKGGQCYRPFEFRDAAVLVRATTHFPIYEAEFKKAGLPYLTISGRGFYSHQEIQDLIALLSALANPLDDLSLATCLRSPFFSLNDETLYQLRRHTPSGDLTPEPIHLKDALANPPITAQPELIVRADTILKKLWSLVARVNVEKLLRTVLELTGYAIVLARSDGEYGRQAANVRKFLSMARDQAGANISDFLRRLRDLQAKEAREGEALGREPESGAIQLMSIHAAKGLEFPVLVVADLGRSKRYDLRPSYLLHDPAFGLVCKVRDEWGDWQEPASYSWGKWLTQKMEQAERNRLLYVACTRAADLLILTGQIGQSDSWLAQVMEAFKIDPDGPKADLIQKDGFGIRVFRPLEPEDTTRVEIQTDTRRQKIEVIPTLARPLPSQPVLWPTAVTQLENFPKNRDEGYLKISPVLWISHSQDSPVRAPRKLIGEMVHQALAHWACLSYPDQELLSRLEGFARRSGVASLALEHAVRTSWQMLMKLKQHRLFTTIQMAKQRYHELPFTLATEQGAIHGVIDLLYQDVQGDWHLLDWKTEWTSEENMEQKIQEHLLQIAVYTLAVKQQLGVEPQTSICFLSPRINEYKVDPEIIREKLSSLGNGSDWN